MACSRLTQAWNASPAVSDATTVPCTSKLNVICVAVAIGWPARYAGSNVQRFTAATETRAKSGCE